MNSEHGSPGAAREADGNRSAPCCGDEVAWRPARDAGSTRCPMAGMCGGMRKGVRGGSRLVIFLFGLILLGLAAAFVLEPHVLLWFAAGLVGLAGLGVLVLALSLRRAPCGGTGRP